MPLRHRDEVVGALNIFDSSARRIADDDAAILHALADVATSVVLQHRALRKARNLAEQLQGALRSRVVVEQAKGILAERLHLEVEDAFEVLRSYARNRNEQLAAVASALIEGRLTAEALLDAARRPHRRAEPPA